MAETQRNRVYRWTSRTLSLRPPLDIEQAAVLITQACIDYGVTPPRVVKNGRRKRSSAWNPKKQQVEIGTLDRVEHILHEATHVIQFRLDILDKPVRSLWTDTLLRADWHGPTFVRLYLDLLARYVGAEYAFAADLLRARYRVRCAREHISPARPIEAVAAVKEA